MLRTMLLFSLVCMLLTASGCRRRPQLWGCTYTNFGGETFTNVVIAYHGNAWPLGDDFRGGGAAKYMGVVGRPPKLVEMGVTSRDGKRHRIYAVVPPEPANRHPDAHFITESRCRGIATWDAGWRILRARHIGLDYLRPRVRWFCAITAVGKQSLTHMTVKARGESYRLGDVGPKADTALGALGRMPKALELGFTAADGKHHQVRVRVPAPPASQGQQPEIYLIVKSSGKIRATYTCPAKLVGVVWCYGVGTNLMERFTNIVVTYRTYKGKITAPWRLDAIAPGGGNGGPTVMGPMPKALDVGFTSPDGKRHKVHVILPPKGVPGPGLPEVYLEIEKGGTVAVKWWQ